MCLRVLFFVVLTLNMLANFVQLVAAGAAEETTIKAVNTFGKEGELETPLAIRKDIYGNVLILDRDRHSIAVYSPWGEQTGIIGEMGHEDGQLFSPLDFDVGAEGTIYVADTGNSRLVLFDSGGNFLRVTDCVGQCNTVDVYSGKLLLVPGLFEHGGCLARAVVNVDNSAACFGKVEMHPARPEMMAKAMNYYLADVNKQIVVIAREAIPRFHIYDRMSGKRLRTVDVRESEVEESYQMYVNAMAERHGANHYESAGLPDTPDGFVREIEATIVPNTRPTYVQYINGIEIYGDRVYILVNGVVLGYSLVGVLEERMTPIGTDEEQIYTHAMWISGDDMLYLIDTAHVLRVYEFMM